MGQKIALVLSGSGARGIAHIGVIEALLSQGFENEEIAGTSMGALVGANLFLFLTLTSYLLSLLATFPILFFLPR